MNTSFDSDSPENQVEDAIDEDNRSDSAESTISSSPDEQDQTRQSGEYDFVSENPNNKDHEEEDDNISEYTWEKNSISSEDEMEKNTDDWYPLRQRSSQYPDIFMPSNTPLAYSFINKNDDEKMEEDSKSDDNEKEVEKNDVIYQRKIKELCPDPSRAELAEIVLDYMICHGIAEPIKTFCKEFNLPIPVKEINLMHIRLGVKEAISSGKIEEAMQKIEEICPGLLESDKKLNFMMKKQNIVEMIREGEMEKPLMYAREELLKEKIDEESLEELEKTFALMAYEVSDTSPYHYLYGPNERNNLANEVNSAILGRLDKAKYSKLDMIAKTICFARSRVAEISSIDAPEDRLHWAKNSFEQPWQLDEYLQFSLEKKPLDLTKDLC